MFSVLRGRATRSAGRLDGPRLVPPRQISAVVCVMEQPVDLADGLLFEPVLGLLLNHLFCRRQLFDGCEPLPLTCSKCLQVGLTAFYLTPSRYSNSLISLQHAEATDPGVCPVVATSNKRLVGSEKIMHVMDRRC